MKYTYKAIDWLFEKISQEPFLYVHPCSKWPREILVINSLDLHTVESRAPHWWRCNTPATATMVPPISDTAAVLFAVLCGA